MKQNIGFKESRISLEHYFLWRKKRAASSIEKIKDKVELLNKRVLDIGCGYGSLSSLLLDKGASVWATEVDQKKMKFAVGKLGLNDKFTPKLVENEMLPFDRDFFDVVFIFDVIEHVKNPEKILQQVNRVLKPGGYLYVEFTPYFSITGHHLYDYTKLPIHILPIQTIKRIVYSKKMEGFMSNNDYWNQFVSLNKLRINELQEMLSQYRSIQENYVIKYPELFELAVPFIKFMGPLKDYVTMSFEGLYRKGVS